MGLLTEETVTPNNCEQQTGAKEKLVRVHIFHYEMTRGLSINPKQRSLVRSAHHKRMLTQN